MGFPSKFHALATKTKTPSGAIRNDLWFLAKALTTLKQPLQQDANIPRGLWLSLVKVSQSKISRNVFFRL
jgi:hypothetical protein